MLYRTLSIIAFAAWSYWAIRVGVLLWPIDWIVASMGAFACGILALREFHDAIKDNIPA